MKCKTNEINRTISDGLGETERYSLISPSLKVILLTSTDDEGSQTRNLGPSPNNTLEKSLKLLRHANQFTVFDKSENRTEIAPRQRGLATPSTVTRRSLVDISPFRTLPKSDANQLQSSKLGSDLSRVSKRRRL